MGKLHNGRSTGHNRITQCSTTTTINTRENRMFEENKKVMSIAMKYF